MDMLPTSLTPSVAALLAQQVQQQQQQQHESARSTTNATVAAALEEEVGRRKAVMAGTPYSITKQFPWRLHEMLDLVEEEGLEEIVSFLPDGRSFKVHDPVRFERGLMRRCFNQTRYKSFQRQLNLWGFERQNDPVFKIKGTYSHPWFIRGRKDLTPLIVRVGGAGNKYKANMAKNSKNSSSEDAALKGKESGGETGVAPMEKKTLSKDSAEENRSDDEVEAAASLAAIHKTGSATSSPTTVPSNKDLLDPKKFAPQPAGTRSGNMTMSNLYNNFLQKNPTASASAVASFLDTFQKRPDFASQSNGKSLSTVMTALQRAEAISSLNARRPSDASGVVGFGSNEGGSEDMIMQRIQQQQRAAAARASLLDEAMKIACDRAPTGSSGLPSGITASAAEKKPLNMDVSATNQGVLERLLNQQQQQQSSNVLAEAAIREMAHQRSQMMSGSTDAGGLNRDILDRLLAQSRNGAPSSQALAGMIPGANSSGMHGNEASLSSVAARRQDMYLEQLRLEEGIQALMRERYRLEAAALLEERERRRLANSLSGGL